MHINRYSVADINFNKSVVNKDTIRDLKGRRRARFELKRTLEDRCVGLCDLCIAFYWFYRHRSGKNRWFFQKLRF